MASAWHMFQECGWPSWLCLLSGLVALPLSVVALVLALLRARTASLLAWLALAAALLPGGVGVAGMALGRAKVDQVLSGVSLDPEQRERIHALGYQEAASCVTVGGTLMAPSLLLAAIALGAALGLRRSLPTGPSRE